jgi:hypothetical protein
MSIVCSCPAAAALSSIPKQACAENFGQIQKIAFQRLHDANGVKNFFDSAAATPNDIKLLASWTAALASATATKIVVSPYISAPATEGGDAVTEGGGNDSVGGIAVVVGSNPVNFTSNIKGVSQAIIKAMKELQCEAMAGNLGVYLFNEHGQIGANQDPSVATKYYPIPVRSLFVGDKMLGGFAAQDYNALNWSFLPGWSDNFAIVSPTDFNPLTDL